MFGVKNVVQAKKIAGGKNTTYKKFKTPNFVICLHSYNYIESNITPPHLVQQK